jgi:hypothetical protein
MGTSAARSGRWDRDVLLQTIDQLGAGTDGHLGLAVGVDPGEDGGDGCQVSHALIERRWFFVALSREALSCIGIILYEQRANRCSGEAREPPQFGSRQR